MDFIFTPGIASPMALHPCFFNDLQPVHCTLRPLNPHFRPFPAFYVLKGPRFNKITMTYSTHRSFQVSAWRSIFVGSVQASED